ncbi:hypothetical protein K490DRAFT_61213 [Saccharata proteae CBS 121410]|uniref:Inner centromere protein ARK-binding domain-containing protein n=1 Tax=Saccharata proteae CBS 121410 TaxID=1314787 RepID=A0A9P4LZU5_9PEZI|nr:hypothetical protein K490DRAFT_61213 [Saccharata proteae CBS 121410]
MASARSKVPVGSAQWILEERRQADQFVEQEAEEFSFSVRNEMEWLNEHMGEIFSQNELNVADVFKTPGKLRGKTPRTARKRNPLEARAPLTDIFAPNLHNVPSPAHNTQFFKQVSSIQIAEDPESPPKIRTKQSAHNSPQPIHQKPQSRTLPTDSGYHDASEDEDEMDMDAENQPPAAQSSALKESPRKAQQSPEIEMANGEGEDGEERATEESFVSAKSGFHSRNPSKEDNTEDDAATVPDYDDDDMDLVGGAQEDFEQTQEEANVESTQYSMGERTASAMNSVLNHGEESQQPETADAENMDEPEQSRTPSQGSSPVKPLLRKSSLTFSSLPAREPIASKKSFGSRLSRASHGEQLKRGSQYGRYTSGKSLGGSQPAAKLDSQVDDDESDAGDEERPEMPRVESDTTKVHNKTSTQRLHDRINMLGQSQETRTGKSISSGASIVETKYPQLPDVEDEKSPVEEAPKQATQNAPPTHMAGEDEDDDWITPVLPTVPSTLVRPFALKPHLETSPAAKSRSPFRFSPQRPVLGHSKSSSVPNFESPHNSPERPKSSHHKMASVSQPNLNGAVESNTPFGSPSEKRHADGPLSASKSRLYSVFKSARNIFASSAGTSAQARIEALSPPSTRSKGEIDVPSMEEVFSPVRAKADTRPAIHDSGISATAVGSPSRNTQSQKMDAVNETENPEELANEFEDEEKHQAASEANDSQDNERPTTMAATEDSQAAQDDAVPRSGATSRAETLASRDDDVHSADEMPPPPAKAQPAPRAREQRSKLAKPGKSTIRQPATHIKVGLGSSQLGRKPTALPTNVDLAQSLQGTFAPSAKAPTEPSAPRSFTKSTNGAPVAKPNSLALAAKKKEEEEQKAQEKADRKKRIEQQKAARAAKAEEERRKAEEERRLETQRKAAEQQRVQEAKRAANKQALALEAKKLEQQRAAASRPQSRANDLVKKPKQKPNPYIKQRKLRSQVHALQQEKSHALPRGDLAGARPLSRMNTVQDLNLNRPNPPINPAKPPKRVFQAEIDEPVPRPQIQRNGPSFQRLDAKRRKTDEDEESTNNRRSVMAPPIRQSNIRKPVYPDRERVLSVLEKAKEPPAKFQHGYMTAPSSSAPAHPHASSIFKQTVTAQHQMQHRTPGHPNDMATISKAKIPFADAPSSSAPAASAAGPSNPYKTPMRGTTTTKTIPTASPHFPTPELPEIATDSEDSDSDSDSGAAAFKAPSWVNSPALRELLSQQQLVDPMEVFGPIPELRMEEIFKNKERQKRFRDRTSSANWNGTDRLTEEERKRDKEAREKMMKDGGWTFGTAS